MARHHVLKRYETEIDLYKAKKPKIALQSGGKNLDRFDALGVKGVYAPERKQGEREHQLHDQNASCPKRVLSAAACRRLRHPVRARGTEHHEARETSAQAGCCRDF